MTDIDTTLYDALLAEADSHAPTSEGMPKVHQRHIFGEWYDGWDACAEVAARLSAERQPVPVSESSIVRHHRIGPGECACGFNAYQIDGIMLDYGELLRAHIRAAARLSAERAGAVVDDTELARIAYYASASVYASEGYDDPDWDRLPEADPRSQEAHIRAAQAVRAAIAAPLPVIPEWVTAVHIDLLGDDSFNFEGGWTEYGTVQSGDGDTLADALQAAIAAQEFDHD